MWRSSATPSPITTARRPPSLRASERRRPAPQPARGIVSRPHSSELADVSGQSFSDPGTLDRNILYNNRAFHWDDTAAGNAQGGLLPLAGSAVYWDLGVVGAGAVCLHPSMSRLTAFNYALDPGCTYPSTGGGSNSTGDPGFPGNYFNDLLAASAADEGGNFAAGLLHAAGCAGRLLGESGRGWAVT